MLAGQILNGIVTGSMYALVAIGFSLVIGTLGGIYGGIFTPT